MAGEAMRVQSALSSDSNPPELNDTSIAGSFARIVTPPQLADTPLLQLLIPPEYAPTFWSVVHNNRTAVAATASALVGVAVGYPFDSIKTRMQTADYPSMRACVKDTYKTEGLGGFYRGCLPTIAIVAFLRSLTFKTYHTSRKLVLHNVFPHPSDNNLPSEDIPVGPTWTAKRTYAQLAATTAIAGATAGTVQSMVNAPLELVKIARQLERMLRLEEEARRKVMQKAFESARLTVGAEAAGLGTAAAAASAVGVAGVAGAAGATTGPAAPPTKPPPVRPIPTTTTLSPNPVTTGTALRSMTTLAGRTAVPNGHSPITAPGNAALAAASRPPPTAPRPPSHLRPFSTSPQTLQAAPLPKPPQATFLTRILTPDSSLGAGYRIARLRGVRALYTGVGLHTLRDFFGTSIYWLTYESLKHAAGLYELSGPWVHMVAGGSAGAVSWLVTFPVDLVKSVVQKEALVGMSGSDRQWRERATAREVATRVWRRGGWRALYNGVGATVVRAIPIHSLTFLVYEAALKWTTEQYSKATLMLIE
ncbi:mitochondrial carrier [Gonapodya prolifera JEL478]|uniref:Mitochondrial carrier n=1 Tax=Gonapodya prolifera (strain JEL478) TaxID=1344416 RepID=A0A139AV33_GONPJ|nr:mitochondrial carrier [Gonapodya prolifera JEL478]|eukprot:KXS20592.1 mitochondrial carrier [Gonapodya prolifera JEL478]